jgi:hypothetical protein
MKKLIPGTKVKVCIGSGLDSSRIGIIQNSKNFSQSFIKQNEPGRYNLFDRKTESILKDSEGNYFTMFNNRLIVVG